MKTSLQSFSKVVATQRLASSALRGRRWGQAVLRGAALLATVTAVCTGVGVAEAQITVRGYVEPIELDWCRPQFPGQNVFCQAMPRDVFVSGTLIFTRKAATSAIETVRARLHGEPSSDELFSSPKKRAAAIRRMGTFRTGAFQRPGRYEVRFVADKNMYSAEFPSADLFVEPEVITVRKNGRSQRVSFKLIDRAASSFGSRPE